MAYTITEKKNVTAKVFIKYIEDEIFRLVEMLDKVDEGHLEEVSTALSNIIEHAQGVKDDVDYDIGKQDTSDGNKEHRLHHREYGFKG